MSTIYEIRRENLRTLIRERGNNEVSKAAGYSSASYISQMAGRKAQRPVTEQTARKIEESLCLPPRWMDIERDAYGHSTPDTTENYPPPVDHPIPLTMVDPGQFAVCAAAVSNAMVAAGARLSTNKFTAIVEALLAQADKSEPAIAAMAETLVKIAV